MPSPLAAKLEALQAGAGCAERGTIADNEDSISTPAGAVRPLDSGALGNRLNRIRRVRERPSQPPRGNDEQALAAWLGADQPSTGLLRVQHDIPFGLKHGRREVQPPHEESLAHFGWSQISPAELAVLDTETTGLSGGVGTVPFLAGIAYFTERSLCVTQYLMTRFEGETPMLKALQVALESRPLVLSYNGKAYDVPLLLGRYRLQRVETTLRRTEHFDLLHPVRRTFKQTWSDCRLGTVERKLFGFQREGDIPGAEIPDVWFRWLKSADRNDLRRVLTHNCHDLVSVALLPDALAEAQHDPCLRGADGSAAAHELLRAGDASGALAHLLGHQNKLSVQGQHLLAILARRAGRREISVQIWRQLSDRGDRVALEHLAKHYEHRAKDYSLALKTTERLIGLARDGSPHNHRRARLLAKLANQTAPANPSHLRGP